MAPVEGGTLHPFTRAGTTLGIHGRDGDHVLIDWPSGDIGAAAISDDGRWLAFVGAEALHDCASIWMVELATGAIVAAPDVHSVDMITLVEWAPDVSHVLVGLRGYGPDTPKWVLDRAGKRVASLPEDTWGVPVWSPDSHWLAILENGLWFVDVTTGETRRPIEGVQPSGYPDLADVAWSPASDRVAFGTCLAGECTIWTSDVDGPAVAIARIAVEEVGTFSWMPGGVIHFQAGASRYRIAPDGSGLAVDDGSSPAPSG
jgi:hypothetical protein